MAWGGWPKADGFAGCPNADCPKAGCPKAEAGAGALPKAEGVLVEVPDTELDPNELGLPKTEFVEAWPGLLKFDEIC